MVHPPLHDVWLESFHEPPELVHGPDRRPYAADIEKRERDVSSAQPGGSRTVACNARNLLIESCLSEPRCDRSEIVLGAAGSEAGYHVEQSH